MQPATTRFAVVLSAVSTLVIVGVLVLLVHHYVGGLTETNQQIEARLDVLDNRAMRLQNEVSSLKGALHQYASR